MIYRPLPISEAKAASVDARLRAIILDNRANKVVVTIPNDPGFALAEGRREAIRKRVAILETKRAKLLSVPQKDLTLLEEKVTVAMAVDVVENDVIDPES
jgi:hypothetical protein